MNNKGFVVSAILYSVLVAFLLFLGVALAMFDASTDVVSNSSDDLVHGTRLVAYQVRGGNGYVNSSEIVKINSRYGIFYWPKDFTDEKLYNGKISISCSIYSVKDSNYNDALSRKYILCPKNTYEDLDKNHYIKMKIIDIINKQSIDINIAKF